MNTKSFMKVRQKLGYKNIFDIGNFAFYKDPDLSMKLASDNLFDQMTPDGWVDIYLGGNDIYLPNFGTFRAHLITNKTFFWDIVDENGNRTKSGFETMWVSRNQNMVPWYGDLIPTNPSKVFDWYNDETATKKTTNLITANLWFYNNFFLDEYYRYYVILLPKGKTWPDEANALILPMNDKIVIPPGYYIVGYRPKPEYRYQLAVMPIIKSGKEYAIHFKFKLDLDYIFSNPTAKRYLKIYSLIEDNPRYLLFPENPKDIIWDRYQEPFIPQYKRYLLEWGIQEYLPDRKKIKHYLSLRQEYLKYSNIIYSLDGFNFASVADQIKQKKANPDYKLTGIAAYIYDHYKKWFMVYTSNSRAQTMDEIMSYILFKQMPWAGFMRLYKEVEGIVDITPPDDTTPADFKPEPVTIVEINGVKQFSDGWIPENAEEYLNPPDGYVYAGATGNGMYMFRVGDKKVSVYCDMDNGGWMLIMDGMQLDTDYVKALVKDGVLPEHLIIDDYGVSFGALNASEVLFYPQLKYKQVKFSYVDFANNCGEFKVEIYSSKNNFVLGQSIITDKCFSELIIDNEVVYTDNTLEKADFYSTKEYNDYQRELTVKMTGGNNFENVRKYIKMLWVK